MTIGKQRRKPLKNRKPFEKNRDDWQTPGPSGPATKRRREKMDRPPFKPRPSK